MWSYCTTAWDGINSVVFDFAESTAGHHARRFRGLQEDGTGRWRGTLICDDHSGYEQALKQMSPILGTIHARRIDGPQDFARHEGEEWIYLLSGTCEVHFEDGRIVELAKGDTLYFDSRIGHAYISTSRSPARTIGACTSESGAMKVARERAPG